MIRKILIVIGVVVALLGIAVAMNPLLLMIPFAMTGKYGGLRSDSTLEDAHARAVTTFVESRGFGQSRMKHLSLWNDRIVHYEGREYDPYQIHLIGLSAEHGERIFADSRPPRKNLLATARHRELSAEELAAVTELRNGMKLSSPIPLDPELTLTIDDAFRILAPLRLAENCMKCHEGTAGDLVGAFAYTLIAADPPATEADDLD